MGFPKDFAWGVATASYQIEGAAYKAGGGLSVWDMFCRRPGKILDGSNGDVACDHFHRYQGDVALMAELGVPNYRFSLSWPRIMPDGMGRVDEAGLAFYERLIDDLLEKGITPWVTLFHWDAPYELYLKGGWMNRDHADWFADYTQVVVDRLGDRVKHWMTLNEPQCFIGLGLESGLHAPGDRLGMTEVLLAGHHALLAHGKACQVIRARSKGEVEVGWAPVGGPKIPATDSAEDIEAAREAMFETLPNSVWSNSWWNDPVFFGHYPEQGLEAYGAAAPTPKAGDMETIQQPLDFYGANIYNGQRVRRGEDGKPQELPHPQGIGRTIYHWPVTPECLYWGPKFFYERYGAPIVITENGIGYSDWVHLDGKIHDGGRIDYLHRHLAEFQRAQDDGVATKGYFQWSFMDNFEWHEGYKHRFGLVYVDYATQERIPKDSAYWYRDVMAANGV
ncbi:GH1 family beta-glucosidase [soil metagenome]